MRRFLQRPGTTVDLGPLEKHLPKIDAREEELTELTDEELTEAAGKAESYVDICAIGREAARRALDQRAFDVQLVGAMAMLDYRVAEMATGEGKTLAAAWLMIGKARRCDWCRRLLDIDPEKDLQATRDLRSGWLLARYAQVTT
jgi:preprotein translocase subunit SecA